MSEVKLTRIVAAILDQRNLTVYLQGGGTVVIPQGDKRVATIVNTATKQLLTQGYADIDLTQYAHNPYNEFEKKSGIVKFFKVAKKMVKNIFSNEKLEVETPTEELEKMQCAIAGIMEHAIPVSAPEFNESNLGKQSNIADDSKEFDEDAEETVIAVIEDKIVPGVERISNQFTHATNNNSTVGMEKFLSRIANVIKARKHSVEDLLKFMERGDLPIADDGSIVIYKVLRKKDGKYVDCHTKKVTQQVGSVVCMKEEMVDPNRNQDCSHGLHVAIRHYLSGFSGDVCVIAKVNPEDVIAVPKYDSNKMRVCAYHILEELSDEDYSKLKMGKPITDTPKGQNILGNIIKGNHIGKLEEVRITEGHGGGVVITKLGKSMEPTKEDVKVSALVDAKSTNQGKLVDPTKLSEKVATTNKQVSTKAELAQDLISRGQWDKLLALKKSSKVSWEKLGVDPSVIPNTIGPTSVEPTQTAPKPAPADVVDGEGSYRERIQKLLSLGLDSQGVAQAILELKKKSKKGFDAMGINPKQEALIKKLTQS